MKHPTGNFLHYFRKKLYLRYLTGFYIHLCNSLKTNFLLIQKTVNGNQLTAFNIVILTEILEILTSKEGSFSRNAIFSEKLIYLDAHVYINECLYLLVLKKTPVKPINCVTFNNRSGWLEFNINNSKISFLSPFHA